MPEDALSRRAVVGGIAAGVAAAATPAALAETPQKNVPQTNPQSAKRDPREQYPKPPFKSQTQPWPGLARDMDPKPDHGETSYRGSGRLKGRKALVTGGDSGIGRAAVIAYLREGADVAIIYYPTEEPDAQEVAAIAKAEGRKLFLMPGDLTDEAFCREAPARAAKELGGLDILVNNAARQQWKETFEEITSEEFDRTFKTNVYAMFWLTQAALPLLKPGSVIIGTTSEQAYDPTPQIAHYAMTKACVANFTKSMAKSLIERGIRVNGVAPGPYWTPLQVSGGASQERLVKFGGDTPMKRPGQPAELGPVFVLLASQESSYATGQVFAATGGNGGP